ncbi:hypothetical protein RRG08_015913 [Elysia crispata]|uniref:Uncharacterized protein n=1 Tax=Elysia crispata TaxID=231223 RepID=A0AAE1AMG4_9GAST|nr:hypothetical protein RRG08_015913 [Elysia crispata]
MGRPVLRRTDNQGVPRGADWTADVIDAVARSDKPEQAWPIPGTVVILPDSRDLCQQWFHLITRLWCNLFVNQLAILNGIK